MSIFVSNVKNLIIPFALIASGCAPLLPYERHAPVRVYEPKVKYNHFYKRYQYVCKRGDQLVRYRGRTVCYDR